MAVYVHRVRQMLMLYIHGKEAPNALVRRVDNAGMTGRSKRWAERLTCWLFQVFLVHGQHVVVESDNLEKFDIRTTSRAIITKSDSRFLYHHQT